VIEARARCPGETVTHKTGDHDMETKVETLIVAGEDLAALIRREHEAASTAARSALEHALEAGRLLARAREGIEHGGWETFVRDRCGIAPRTARLYLRLDANRERLANRQRVAGLTVREAARVLAEPRPSAADQCDRVDRLGPHWLELTPVSAEWNPHWPLAEDHPGETVTAGPPRPPQWYAPRCWHFGQHSSGWSLEVSPDAFTAGRVHAVVHDPSGTIHLASFDGMSPAALVPFLTACERHHAVPEQGDGWTITTCPEHAALRRRSPPFPFRVFHLAWNTGHRAYCWAMIDEGIGLAARGEDPGPRAWEMFMHALAAIVKADPVATKAR